MSQIFKGVTASNLPPSVPTSFTLDTGTAIPSANILQVNGFPGSGITTQLGASNQIYVNFSESILIGTITTSDGAGQTQTLLSVPLGSSAGVFTVDVKITAFCTSGPDANNGNGYTVVGSILATGITGSILPNPAIDQFEGIASIISPVFTVIGNNAIIQVTGLVGDTINWKAEAQYIFRGAI